MLTTETTSAPGIRDMKNLKENIILFIHHEVKNLKLKIPEKVVDDLDPTKNGETSEETHCASN